MRKYALALLFLSTALAPASAEVTMKLPDDISKTFVKMQTLLDECIGSAVSHSDSNACLQLRGALVQLANQPTTPVATTKGAESKPTPTPENLPEKKPAHK